MANLVYLTNVRLSFPTLVEPRSSVKPSADNPNPAKKYSADFIMDSNHPGMAAFMKEYATEAAAKWKEHANAVMGMIQNDRRLRCYGVGTERVNQKTFKMYDGYEGKVYVSANSDKQPQMINPDGSVADSSNTMLTQSLARKLYGGCYVNVAIQPWLQDNSNGRAVRCNLIAIQFAADGDAFGDSEPDVTGVFGAVATAATATAATATAAPSGMPALPSFMTGS